MEETYYQQRKVSALHINIFMAAVGLWTQEAEVSAAMTLTWFAQNIVVSSMAGLNNTMSIGWHPVTLVQILRKKNITFRKNYPLTGD